MFSLTFSLALSSLKGREPMRIWNFSASNSLAAVFLSCSLARWGSRSVMQNTGSPSSSPMVTVTVLPSLRQTTPWRAKGRVGHWNFLMPP